MINIDSLLKSNVSFCLKAAAVQNDIQVSEVYFSFAVPLQRDPSCVKSDKDPVRVGRGGQHNTAQRIKSRGSCMSLLQHHLEWSALHTVPMERLGAGKGIWKAIHRSLCMCLRTDVWTDGDRQTDMNTCTSAKQGRGVYQGAQVGH